MTPGPRGRLLIGALALGVGCSTPAVPASVEPSAATTPAASTTMAPAATETPTAAPTVRDDELLLVTVFADAHLVLVDPDEGEIARIEVGRSPWGVAVAPDGRAYVATFDGVAVVDVEARERTGLISYASELAAGPTAGEYRPGGLGIAVSPRGDRVYVGVTTNFPDPGVLEVIDTASGTTIGSVPVGIRQFDVVVSDDGATVYAINHDSFDVTVVDAASLTVTRMVVAAPLGDELGLGSWNKPHYAALTAAGTLLMAYKGVLLLELDPRTGGATSLPLRSSTHSQGVELTPDGASFLVVGDGPDDTSLAGPSLEIVALTDGSSTVVALDGSHNDVAVSADGRRAYVTGGSSREGVPYPGVITVVDLREHLVIGAHPVVGNPLIITPWPPR